MQKRFKTIPLKLLPLEFVLQVPPGYGHGNGYLYANDDSVVYGHYKKGSTASGRHQQQPRSLEPQESEWTNIIPTVSGYNPRNANLFRNSFSYDGNFIFYGLNPSTEYEVIIQAKNREGWSDPNTIFTFTTRSRGKKKLLLIILISI